MKIATIRLISLKYLDPWEEVSRKETTIGIGKEGPPKRRAKQAEVESFAVTDGDTCRLSRVLIGKSKYS